MGELLLLFASAALALGVPAFLISLWRALPAIWRGERHRPPVENFYLFSVLPRSYLSGLLAITAWFGGFTGLGAQLLIPLIFNGAERWEPGDGSPYLVFLPFILSLILWAAAVPLTVLQWVVNAFNRPRMIVPPKYRDKPGSLGERARRRERRRAALPPTEHLVEIVEGDPGEGPGGRFLVAVCDEGGCGWMEFADEDAVEDEEENLRAKAARHSSRVAAGVIRPGADT